MHLHREEQAEIDDIYQELTETIVSEMKYSIPNFPMGGKCEKRYKPKKHFWNEELQKLWNNMHSKEKTLQSFNSREDKRNRQRLGPIGINLTRGVGILREDQGIQ